MDPHNDHRMGFVRTAGSSSYDLAMCTNDVPSHSLVALKLLLGTNLVSYASRRYATVADREQEEELNARDRQPIGVDKEEKVRRVTRWRGVVSFH